MKRIKKEARDKGYRKFNIKLRKILNEGLFVGYPLTTNVAPENESRVLLWRAVIDQHLKDIISHHLIKRDFYNYYNARVFFDEQVTEEGQESTLAFLNPKRIQQVVMRIEKLCRELRDRGIELSE